ncbi:MAG TPA: carboxymuconolactone decarboxylase family protein [Acidimicrobiia bacterium]|nr:carboxymuconolactone decarboxylase family protein [Acidimicrobiia bacterium]
MSGNGGYEFVPLVPVDELPDDLREQWEGTTRPGLRDFIRIMGHAPDHFRRYNEAYLPLRFDNHLGPRLTEIVRLAVAQTTRCPVCMAGRVPAATEAGLTEDLVSKLATGDRAGFTDDECVAIDYVLKLATDHQSIGQVERAAMRTHFTPTQIVEINLLAVMCLVGRFSMLCGLEESPS